MLTLANLLTFIRLLLILPSIWAISTHAWLGAALIFIIAVISDIGDGIAARRMHQSSAFGGLFDHTTDALFVATSLAAFAIHGNGVPMCLPALIVIAFIQYVLDSKALQGKSLRTSMLGRYNGIAYFVLLGLCILQQLPRFDWIPAFAISLFAWVLITSTVLSIIDRAWALIKIQRGR